MMDLAMPADPASKDTDADCRRRAALQPTLAVDNPAALVFGLGSSGRGPLKNVPNVSFHSEGECALGASVTDS
jgi:hypothetical protein